MAEAEAAAVPAPLLPGLPDEIMVWEILVRLPPKSLLRSRVVSPAWRSTTSSRRFLLAHHARQPSLPIVCASECAGARHENILSFDHRAADSHLQPIARFEGAVNPVASCDGLLILDSYSATFSGYLVCNLATRQHAPLRQLSGFRLLGMYAHRSTGEYRLLMRRALTDEIDCKVFSLCSDQPPRHIGGLLPAALASGYLHMPALLRDSLHWYPVHFQGSEVVMVFDTMSESSRLMRAPDDVSAWSEIFEMDGMLGIYSCGKDMGIVDIFVLQNYEGEVWERKYNVKYPIVEIKGQFYRLEENCGAVSVNGDILLMVKCGRWLFYIDTNGKLIAHFSRDGQELYGCRLRIKQSLVPHPFFTAEGHAVNASPFI